MDRLDELEVFIAILDNGSLAAAARKLRRSAPAVTRSVGTLEERLGVRLIERTTRRLAPTDAGKRLAEHARKLLSDYDVAIREHEAAPPRGLLRVTAPTVFGRRHVAPLINRFLDQHPAVQVELVLNDRNLDLIEENLDAAVRIGKLADAGMVARRVGEVRRMLVASPAYLQRRGKPASLADLPRHELIFTTSRSTALDWHFRQNGHDRLLHLSPRLMVNDVEAVLMAARAGRGMARALSYQVADDLAAGTLVRLLPECEPEPLPVQIVVSSVQHMAPRLRAFLEHAVGNLERLAVLKPMK